MSDASRFKDTGGMTPLPPAAVIRKWARDNGIHVGDRGRLSPDLLAAYSANDVSTFAPPAKPQKQQVIKGSGGMLRVAVLPVPGATGVGRRVIARIS
jgi:hypothetical protein